MPAVIQIRKNADAYEFVLVSGNGEAILTSEGFRSTFSCKEAASMLPKLCSDSINYEKKDLPDGQCFFILKNDREEIFATSQRFWAVSSRNYAMLVVMREGPTAKIM